MGGNDSDTYVIGHKYGLFNVIDNFAEDEQVDNLLLEIMFHHIDISLHGADIILQSSLSNNSVKVNIRNYFQGKIISIFWYIAWMESSSNFPKNILTWRLCWLIFHNHLTARFSKQMKALPLHTQEFL